MFRRLRAGVRAAGSAVADEVASHPVAQDPWVRHYFASWVSVLFLIATVPMFIVSWGTLPETHQVPAYAMPVVAACAAFPLALAWAAPLSGWAFSVVAAQIIGVVVPTAHGWPWTIQVTHLIVLLVLTVMCLLRVRLRYVPIIWACSTAVIALAAPAGAKAGWAFGLTTVAVVVMLLRGLLASRRQLATRTEETRAAESETAVLQERARIARDLHDVVAHRMSMVVVMAQTARYRLSDVSPESAAEFDAIADAARASLDEVRQLLGVLRVEDRTPRAAPNPGMADIVDLVAQTRRAGATVAMADTVDYRVVGEAQALVVYRIVQEALANATRHAPGADIAVHLDVPSGSVVDVCVTNTAPTGEYPAITGSGNGIRGMLERANAVGGTLRAAPTVGGGFAVQARIPVSSRPIGTQTLERPEQPAVEG